MASEFPWETLRAETLRVLCKDLELPPTLGRKREDMILAMKRVGEEGLPKFIKKHEAEIKDHPAPRTTTKAKPAKTPPLATRTKANLKPRTRALGGKAKARTVPAAAGKGSRSAGKTRSSFSGVLLSAGSHSSRRQSAAKTVKR